MPNPTNKALHLNPEYFWSFSEKVEDCLIWTGHATVQGYGHIKILGKMKLAHRHAWELANGTTIPAKALVLHSCDRPACVNPAHLRLGNHADNTADAIKRGRYVALRGKLNGNTIRTESEIRAIRRSREDGETYRSIAKRYGTTPENIFAITSRRTWRHIS